MSGLLFFGSIIGFGFGVLLRSLFELPTEFVLLLFILAFALAVFWRRERLSHTSPIFIISIILVCVGLGVLRVDTTTWQPSAFEAVEETDVVIEGVVVREPDIRTSTQHLYVKERSSEELVLVTTDRFVDVSYGDVVRVEGEVTRPESFETDLGRTFNYPGYLRARGVTHALFFADVFVEERGEGGKIRTALFVFKHWFMHSFEQFVPEPSAGLGEGLLLGVKRALGEDLDEVFRVTGIIHIVVLSGYNVMIVAEAIMRLLSFAFAPRIRVVIGVVAIASFALMVGLTATVVRASIMAILVLIARATGRTTAILRALLLAGFVMVLLNPYLLAFDPGFQLSFLATLGLIVLAPYLEKVFHLVPTKLQIREFVVATIATQIMVLPLLLYSIGQFSAVSVVVNVLVLPAVPFAMGMSFVTGVVGAALPALGMVLGFGSHLLLAYIIGTASLFAALPFAAYVVPQFPFWVVIVSYAGLAYVLWRLHTREEKIDEGEGNENEFDDWTIVSLEEMKAARVEASADVPRGTSADAFPFR